MTIADIKTADATNMTIADIKTQIRRVKPCSTASLYRYLRALDIQPVAVRQRPQHYPADTAQRILRHLGLDGMLEEDPPASGTYYQPGAGPTIVSTGELCTIARKARRAK